MARVLNLSQCLKHPVLCFTKRLEGFYFTADYIISNFPQALAGMKSLKRMKPQNEQSGGDVVLQRVETQMAEIKRYLTPRALKSPFGSCKFMLGRKSSNEFIVVS